MAQKVKNLPAMQETRVQYMGQEDPLEKGMATHSSSLAWRIPWTEEPWGRKMSDMIEQQTFALGSKYFRLCKPHSLSLQATHLWPGRVKATVDVTVFQ